jgi:DNA-binding SARP family transcriptional activator
MHFHVLGPLEVIGPAGPLHLAGRRRRALLAVLLIHPGRSVSLPGLVDGIWADNPPHSAIANIRNYVSDFRRQLKQVGDSPARLASNLTGYRLDVAAEELDLFRYSALVADGRQALRRSDHRRAADRFGLALGLWRGRPLEDLPGLGGAMAAKLDALEEQRWAVTASWVDVRLAMGHHDELIPVLRQMVAERPLDEQVRAQLIIALHAVGRKADALVAFRDARRAAVDELGVEPGGFLQRLHTAILAGEVLPAHPSCESRLIGELSDGRPYRPVTVAAAPVEEAPVPDRIADGRRPAGGAGGLRGGGDSSGDGSRDSGDSSRDSSRDHSPGNSADGDTGWTRVLGGPRRRPSGLPPMPRQFVGRDAVAARLEAIGRAAGDCVGSDVHSSVVAISGAPGVGKSTLALIAAYRLQNQYPDGQLFLALHGSTDRPLSVADALAELLCLLGVDRSRVPVGRNERTALYRTMLADRRMLLVLDDVTSARAVRPLLPGAGSCLAIVTSGPRLVELDAAWSCNLEPPTEADAVRMLAELVGRDRVDAEPDGAARIVEACGRLPLAVRVAGLRLSTLPGLRLATFAERLEDEEGRLDELAVGEISVRSRLARSYRILDPTARRLLAAMGRSEERTFTGATAGRLLDVPDRVADRVLELLAGHNVLCAVGGAASVTQQYEMPALMKAYMRENPESPGPAADVRDGTPGY